MKRRTDAAEMREIARLKAILAREQVYIRKLEAAVRKLLEVV
jgi:hypothetical protein